ncbi:MAG TPA: head GIN domain-containing protein [Chthoniobacterales bacterium]|nr:head GIN domain-containing protein [Chthoniobacterales bacterium]
MNKTTIALLTAMLLAGAGCDVVGIMGNGHIVTDTRPVVDFSEIEANGGFYIEWKSGPPSLSITTDQNLLQYITTENVDHRLRLHSRGNLRPTRHVDVVISSPARAGAKLTGAARMTANQLSGPNFAVESTGAAKVHLDGKVDDLITDMTGASKLEADTLQTRTAEISSTGASKAEVAVSESLKVSITGAGKVVYSGNPSTVEKHVSGAGSIHHKD